VPGTVRLSSERRGTDSVPFGHVESLSVDSVSVPAKHHGVFGAAYKDSEERAPRDLKYEVKLAFGRRAEPWIVDVPRGAK
jgi:hypothetical protein